METKVYVYDPVEGEIRNYEREIRSLRAEKSHLRRWINDAKRSLQPYAWELRDAAAGVGAADAGAERIGARERQIAHHEAKYAKLDETITRWKLEIEKLKASKA
jgi:cell division protein FtsB